MKCLICPGKKNESELIKLRCSHIYCWLCMENYLKENLQPQIKCPADNCNSNIRDAEIRKVLSREDIVRYENMCLDTTKKIHFCLLKKCSMSIAYSDINIQYGCISCSLFNCISCNAAHMFATCAEFKNMNESEKKSICQIELERANSVFMEKERNNMIHELKSIEDMDIIKSNRVFECSICMSAIGKEDGVQLRTCGHNICKSCLSLHIAAEGISVGCPESDCGNKITEQEIQKVLTEKEWQTYIERCVDFATRKNETFRHCKTPNCDAVYDCSSKQETFTCLKCKEINCLKCNTVHSDESCEQYQNKLKNDPNVLDIENQIKCGQLMKCCGCKTLIKKVRGCNWIKCSKCSMELCWIRQMPRWGPNGRGDTSGGCKCFVNDEPCHPDCVGCQPHVGGPQNLSSDSDSDIYIDSDSDSD